MGDGKGWSVRGLLVEVVGHRKTIRVVVVGFGFGPWWVLDMCLDHSCSM